MYRGLELVAQASTLCGDAVSAQEVGLEAGGSSASSISSGPIPTGHDGISLPGGTLGASSHKVAPMLVCSSTTASHTGQAEKGHVPGTLNSGMDRMSQGSPLCNE